MQKEIKIQVLGSGCPSCKKLFELTKKAATELGIKEEVEYVTDIQKIIEMGVMQSPVLAINGKPVSTGYIDNIEQIKKVISDNDNSADSDCGCSCCDKC